MITLRTDMNSTSILLGFWRVKRTRRLQIRADIAKKSAAVQRRKFALSEPIWPRAARAAARRAPDDQGGRPE